MRYTRQELKQDRLQETAADAMHWSVVHRKNLTMIGIVLAVIVVAAIGGGWYYTYHNEQANNALGTAMLINGAPILPKGAAPEQVLTFATIPERAAAAKTSFYDVSSKYGSTRAGRFARYMAGVTEVELGNNKAAEEDFKAVSEVSDQNVANLARFALASVYRDTNREADAIAIYKALSEHPSETVPKVTAQLELAELYTAKQPDEAKKIYAQIQKDNPKALAAEVAGQHLKDMK